MTFAGGARVKVKDSLSGRPSNDPTGPRKIPFQVDEDLRGANYTIEAEKKFQGVTCFKRRQVGTSQKKKNKIIK